MEIIIESYGFSCYTQEIIETQKGKFYYQPITKYGDLTGEFYEVTMLQNFDDRGRIFYKDRQYRISEDIYNRIKNNCKIDKNFQIIRGNKTLTISEAIGLMKNELEN